LTSLQQDESTLPKGPVIMSPDRLMYSFKREVIYKRPEVFKIATLREIKSLFPAEHNPFYSGFGNRETVPLSLHFLMILGCDRLSGSWNTRRKNIYYQSKWSNTSANE
jgi:phosphatidate phosphatase PAH1